MWKVAAPTFPSHSVSSKATNSGPLSERSTAGRPWRKNSRPELLPDARRGQRAAGGRGQGLARMLIDHRQHLEHASPGGGVEDEVMRPDVVGVFSLAGHALAAAQALAWPPRGQPEAELAPEAQHALAVHLVAFPAQLRVHALVAPARLALVDRLDGGHQSLV